MVILLGARGIYETRLYLDPKTAYDNNASVITSTYHGGSGALKLYTTHCTPSTNPNRDYEFRMTQLNGWDMNPNAFRQGASALRYAREWAKEERERLIAAANGKIHLHKTLSNCHRTTLLVKISDVG